MTWTAYSRTPGPQLRVHKGPGHDGERHYVPLRFARRRSDGEPYCIAQFVACEHQSDPWDSVRVAFEAEATFNRKEFGLTWNQALEAGGVLVGKEMTISLEIQAVQEEDTEAA